MCPFVWVPVRARVHVQMDKRMRALSQVPYISIMWPFWAFYRILSQWSLAPEERHLLARKQMSDNLHAGVRGRLQHIRAHAPSPRPAHLPTHAGSLKCIHTGRAIVVTVGHESNCDTGGDAAAALLQDIFSLQRSESQPLVLCPMLVVWSREPLLTPSPKSLATRIFGSRRQPGLMRAFASMLWNRRPCVQIGGGAPINVAEWLLEFRAASHASPQISDDELSRRLLHTLHARFSGHWLQVA